MAEDQEIIEIKFEGNGIKPSKVKASEIAELIKSYETSIVSLIKREYPELDEDFVLLSFDQIDDKSISIKCLAHKATQYVIPAYLLLTTSVASGNYNQLPQEAVEGLRCLTRFSKKHNCDGNFIQNNQRLASFHPDTKITYSNENVIKGETTIFGEVQRAGGVDPRVTLKINNEYTISFDVKKEIAIQLAGNLYKDVSLLGIATWDKKTYRVLDFKAKAVSSIREHNITETFKGLNKLFGKHLDNPADSDSFIN